MGEIYKNGVIKINRPIIICTLGYMIGILNGLYFKKSIAFIIISIFFIIYIKNYKQNNKIIRYLKLLLKFNVIMLFLIFYIISNIYLSYINYKYETFYNNAPEIINSKAVIIEEGIEKEYIYSYLIKVKEGKYKNKKFILNINKGKNTLLKYGDLIEFNGEYIIPNERRNYKGFNYREYLKSKKIYGTIKCDNTSINIINKKSLNCLLLASNDIRNSIIKKTQIILPNRTNSLLIGILLGDKNNISEDTIENFRTSNLSHILSVSGAHTAYIILGVTYLLYKSKISKKIINIITILILFIFMFITNFTPSVIRACLTSMIAIASKSFYRKSDIISNISLSLIIILLFNPYAITEIGLQLSYLGTLGLILFNKNVENLLSKIKINKKVIKLITITISAQIMIIPIMALNFNTISLTFFISNLLASPILGTTIILGFITIFVSFISFKIAKLLAIILNLLLEILMLIAKIVSKIPFSTILVKTPYIICVILLYLFILMCNYIYTIYNSKEHMRIFQKRLKKVITLRNIKKFLSILFIVIFLFNIIFYSYIFIFQNLKIYFVDVGQGDCTLIVTPHNKKILIDGGDGKLDILLPYLLDRRIKTIDYIIISHFDSDHVGRNFRFIKKSESKKCNNW